MWKLVHLEMEIYEFEFSQLAAFILFKSPLENVFSLLTPCQENAEEQPATVFLCSSKISFYS